MHASYLSRHVLLMPLACYCIPRELWTLWQNISTAYLVKLSIYLPSGCVLYLSLFLKDFMIIFSLAVLYACFVLQCVSLVVWCLCVREGDDSVRGPRAFSCVTKLWKQNHRISFRRSSQAMQQKQAGGQADKQHRRKQVKSSTLDDILLHLATRGSSRCTVSPRIAATQGAWEWGARHPRGEPPNTDGHELNFFPSLPPSPTHP